MQPTLGNMEFLMILLPVLLYSTVCGGLIGFERAMRGSAAGMKTQIFICVGAALYTVCSAVIFQADGSPDGARIVAQIVSGVGFLGAGTIMARDRVVGLTTAAIIWVMAALGVIIGLGYGPVAVVASFGMFVAIKIITAIEKRYIPTHYEGADRRTGGAGTVSGPTLKVAEPASAEVASKDKSNDPDKRNVG